LPALTPDRRKALLTALRTGLRLEVACAKLGIKPRDIEATGKRFREQVAEAEVQGDALIEATLYERGLAGDAACLKLAIERRDRSRPVDGEPETLADLLRSMSAPARDELRGAIDAAIEKAKQQVSVKVMQITEDGVPLPAAGGSQGAAAVAGHTATSPAVVAAPGKPEPPVVSREAEMAARVEDRHIEELFERQRRMPN
jgi:hypothetical protein